MERRLRARLTRSEGRKFAFTVGLAFLVLAGILWWRQHSTGALMAAGLGSLLLTAGLLIPTRLGPVYRGWMALALAISKVTTPILMGIVYFFLMMPIGVLRRVLGGNPIRHESRDEGYWKSRAEGARRSDLQRQF